MKKSFKITFTVLLIAVIFTASSCKKILDISEDKGEGWPSNSILKDYGLDGLAQPPGVTAATWEVSSFTIGMLSDKSLKIDFIWNR